MNEQVQAFDPKKKTVLINDGSLARFLGEIKGPYPYVFTFTSADNREWVFVVNQYGQASFGSNRNNNFDVKNVTTPKWRWMSVDGGSGRLFVTNKWYASKEEAEKDSGYQILAPIESTRIDE